MKRAGIQADKLMSDVSGIWWELGYSDALETAGYGLPWLHHIGVTECNRQLFKGQLTGQCRWIVELIGEIGSFPTAKEVHCYSSRSDNCHHQIKVLVEGIIKGVESKRESGFRILVRHPCPLVFGQTLIESPEESADLIFIATGTR